MDKKPSCFVAYPSQPVSIAETVEEAITKIAATGVVTIKGWKETRTGGKFLIKAICGAIDKDDILIAELTRFNPNVLFELGYGIAKNKRILILMNTGVEGARQNYAKFRILLNIGYSPYVNSDGICSEFFKAAPFEDIDETIYRDIMESVEGGDERKAIMYVKSGINTDASIKLSRLIDNLNIPNIMDDPVEIPTRTLSWYATNIRNSFATLVHLMGEDQIGSRFHNSRNSFVAGLAYGFKKNLLMLAHEPYDPPIDYCDLLFVHNTASKCASIASPWLEQVKATYKEYEEGSVKKSKPLKTVTGLKDIKIGDPHAENEAEDLPNYFVATATYEEISGPGLSVVIGRRGSGKTAILYKLQQDYKLDPRNLVCIIKPVAYEMSGILDVLRKSLRDSEKGYLVESFWKYLIYSELARGYYLDLKGKSQHYQKSEPEERLFDFVDANSGVILPEFSIRLEQAIQQLLAIDPATKRPDQRVRMSELLHEAVIEKLRSVLGDVLTVRREVGIIIDDLDKAWQVTSDNEEIICRLLSALLRVSSNIVNDFKKRDHWRKPVSLSLVVFLRSDIFDHVLERSPEPDKVPQSWIEWEDKELLLKVIEERFVSSARIDSNPKIIWDQYFCDQVAGIPTPEYIIGRILPRPRDLIYLIKTALDRAINLDHYKIEQGDIKAAEKGYSQYALTSIIAETKEACPWIENLLYEFVGRPAVVFLRDIKDAIREGVLRNGKEPAGDTVNKVIDLLCHMNFLGREVEPGIYRYQYNERDRKKIEAMANIMARANRTRVEHFRIHDAFQTYLEIRDVRAGNEAGL